MSAHVTPPGAAAARGFVRATVPLGGIVGVPGSKSLSNRALVCAALADGASRLVGVADGDDTRAMIVALRRMGAEIVHDGGDVVVTRGIDRRSTQEVHLDARLAGTTARFLVTLAMLRAGRTTIDGAEPLRRRPMDGLAAAGESMGAHLEWLDRPGHLPVRVTPAATSGRGSVTMRADVSSQFVSGLLLAAGAGAPVNDVRVEGDVVSHGYLDMTTAVMAAFGADVSRSGSGFRIASHGYRGAEVVIEADVASASYPLAAALIVGGSVTVPRVVRSLVQPEVGVLDVFEAMGGDLEWGAHGLTLHRDPTVPLRGVDVSMADFSDLVPTVAVVAASGSSPTTIRDVGFIRAKESDRLGDLAAEMAKCGIDAEVLADGLRVVPGAGTAATVDAHHDHRLAMSLALLGLRIDGVFVADPDVVSKSWPTYWDAMSSVARVRTILAR
jgi:3-phosphoshikimate 1-carboxyvinyltransferase